MSPSRSTLAAVAAGGMLALGIAGAAVMSGTGALAASPAPSASGAAPGQQGTPPGGARGFGHGPGRMGPGMGFGGFGLRGPGALGAGVLHGEVVVKKADGSGTETLLVQQGTVTAKGTDTVTVKSSDGFTVTWTVSSTTQIHAKAPTTNGQPPARGTKPANGTLADVATGQEVGVIGTKTGTDAGAARSIGARPAGTPGVTGGRQGFGHRGPNGATPAPSASATTSGTLYRGI